MNADRQGATNWKKKKQHRSQTGFFRGDDCRENRSPDNRKLNQRTHTSFPEKRKGSQNITLSGPIITNGTAYYPTADGIYRR